MRAVLVAAAMMVGCTGGASSSFRILVNDQPIEITAPSMVIVETFVIDAPTDQVVITSPNLPRFATISGESIALAPVVEDAGDYSVELVATSGGESAHATLPLHVVAMNTGPMWQPTPYFSSGSPPTMRAPVCDKEHDNFTFEISVALVGQTIPDTAMFSHFIDFSQIQPIMDPEAGWCADFITELPGLATGSYHGAVHAFDVHGAEDPYGWVELGGTFSAP